MPLGHSDDPQILKEYSIYNEYIGEFYAFPARKKPSKPNKANRARLKLRVFTRDNFTCQEVTCGKVFEAPENFDGTQTIPGLTLGHIIPQTFGGRWTQENLKAECYDCNHSRGNSTWT